MKEDLLLLYIEEGTRVVGRGGHSIEEKLLLLLTTTTTHFPF